jgi:transposase
MDREACRALCTRSRKKFKPKKTGFKHYVQVSNQQRWSIVYERFGCFNSTQQVVRSIPEISARLNLQKSTVANTIYRFRKKGNVDDQRVNNISVTKYKITQEIKDYLLHPSTFQRWAGLNNARRVQLLKESHGLSLSPDGLRKFYVRNNIRFRHCNYTYDSKTADLDVQRARFAFKLTQLISSGAHIVYIDESSFNNWKVPRKTWYGIGMNVKLVLPSKRGQAITVLGAIGTCLKVPCFLHGRSTSLIKVEQLMRAIRTHAIPNFSEPIHVVMDNHACHRSAQVQALMLSLNLISTFQPAYSPEFNCIERVWGNFKKRLQQAMLPFQSANYSEQSLNNALIRIERAVTYEEMCRAALGNNREYLQQQLTEHAKLPADGDL